MFDEVYTDGGVIPDGNGTASRSVRGGPWAYVLVDSKEIRQRWASGIITPDPMVLDSVTNNVTELAAMIFALEQLPKGWSGRVYTDSIVTLGRMRDGWRMKGVPVKMQHRAYDALQHIAADKVEWVLLQGHPTLEDLERGIGKKRGFPVSRHNVMCDTLCNERISQFYLGPDYIERSAVMSIKDLCKGRKV